MKFAEVKGERKEAQPGLSGLCEVCCSEVSSRCGEVNIWHWAHVEKIKCDPWWESETEWHRHWKNAFPKEWQEKVCYDENGEKHIADVRTDKGNVIEFQHSDIKLEERQAREDFYGSMFWIVHGTKRPEDKRRFFAAFQGCELVDSQYELKRLPIPLADSECNPLLKDWVNSTALVFFDFDEDFLFGIFQKIIKTRVAGTVYAFKIKRDELIKMLSSSSVISIIATVLLRTLRVQEKCYLKQQVKVGPI